MAYRATAFFGSGVTGIVEGDCTLMLHPRSTGTGVEIDGANWSLAEMGDGFYGLTVEDAGITEASAFHLYVTVTPTTEAWGSIGDDILLAKTSDIPEEASVVEVGAWSTGTVKTIVCLSAPATEPVAVVVEGASGFVRDNADGGIFKAIIAVTESYAGFTEDESFPGVYWLQLTGEDWRDGAYTAYVYSSSDLTQRPVASHTFEVYRNAIQVVSSAVMRRLRNIEVRS